MLPRITDLDPCAPPAIEDNLRTNILFQLMLMYGLHTARSTHRHENGSLYLAVVGMKGGGTGTTTGGIKVKGQWHRCVMSFFKRQKYEKNISAILAVPFSLV